MDASECRKLADIPNGNVTTALPNFMSNAVPELFQNCEDLNSPPKDQIVFECLINPLQWMLFGGDPAVALASFENHGAPSNFCGKVFKSGEPAYFCKDCQTDPTCCLCMECFERSEHKTHKYRLFASGGGGCCDCGDPEAWTSGVFCEFHEPSLQKDDEEVDPVKTLPTELATRAQVFFKTLLGYCMNILTCSDQSSLPSFLQSGKSTQCLQQDSFRTYLYNDEVHSYDDVIYTLTHKVNLTHTEAVALATFVDRKGRAIIKGGSRLECQKVSQQINSDVRPPLKVEVFHAAVATHQDSAVICLSLLKDLAEKVAAFRRIISQSLVDTSFQPWGLSILDEFFITDNSLWISARISWHRLVMSSIFMDATFKKQLAISLTRNYCQLQKNFVADSHHHDVCASNMTVQIFTAPSLSRMLVLEHGLLKIILTTLQELLSSSRDSTTGRLKLRTNNYKHSRIFYIVYDLRYVLRTKPDEWTPLLRQQVLEAYDCLLKLLSWLQNADPVHRQRQIHVEREEPWEHCFNFSILMQPAILLFLEWCVSDSVLLQNCLSATCKMHELIGKDQAKIQYKAHNCEKSIVGRKSMDLIVFDILKESVSIHQPLPRMIATLLSGAHQHGLTLPQLLKIPLHDHKKFLFLMEYSSRAIVMAVQVMAGMWKRNGYSVVNQIINYQYHHSREIMYDKDILMLQSMASILDPDMFLYALVYKFRLEKWLSSPDSDPSKRGEPTEDALRFFISEAEEFLFLILVIYSERYVGGVGENITKDIILKREVIHRLFISPLSHSEILKHLKLNDSDCNIDAILKEVATLRRQHGSSGKHVYELKTQYEKECCPFFYHYTKPDHSKAEEIRRKKVKALAASKATTASPPLKPPPFTLPYAGVLKLAQCSVLHRMLHCILKQASTPDSKFWSDKLLHEALYLCGVILVDEDSDHPESLCNAAIGVTGNHPFLPQLEILLSHQRAEEHQSLLAWCVQYLRTKQTEKSGNGVMDTDGAQGDGSKEMTDAEREAQEKRDKGLEKRAKLMSQISIMQKEFLRQHRKELENIDLEEDDGYGNYVGDVYQHDCAVGAPSLLHHVPFKVHTTCILCQEESKDFARQKKPYVQAVNVQRSSLLTRRKKQTVKNLCDYSKVDFISSRYDISHGVFTGGCGHNMHAECWKSFLDNKRVEHARHHFFPLPGQSVEWDSGEFLCPLCQCYSNTVLPLLPQVGQLSVGIQLSEPNHPVSMLEWRKLLTLAVELGSGDAMDTGVSVDPTFLDKLQDLFSAYRKPTVLSESNEVKLAADMQEVFSQSIFMCAYGVNPDISDERVCLAQWNNCAYVISSLENTARCEDKFLLSADTLSSRQFNMVRSLVRLGSESRIRPDVSVQAKHLQFLMNCILLDGPAFPELPSLLDLNCFLLFVNLHFSISAMFLSLSSPHGYRAPLEGDPIILQLMGITNAHLVKITAAAHMLQFLLAYTVVGEPVGDAVMQEQDLDLTDGTGLQKLWVKYRKLANLPHDDLPSPNDLSVCLRQHMYPFLQCTALFLHCLTGIDFVHSSATIAMRHEDLCKYVGLPSNLTLLFDVDTESICDDSTAPQQISSLARNWCKDPRIGELLRSSSLLPVLQEVKTLQELPESYSVLVKKAANFQCSKRLVEENYADDGQAAMMCLICGTMLCTNSYCCQTEVEKEDAMDDKKTRIGGFTQHSQRCGSGIGIALWILESYVVLLDATNIHSVKGCTLTPPYLDEYGETDPGLRRGNPLSLNRDVYEELKQVWFQHHIPQRIRKEMEGNPGLMRIKWDHM